MRKAGVLILVVLFSFCSIKERTHYPRIILAERKNPIQVNTKTMLHVCLDNTGSFFVGNFDSDTIINSKWKEAELKSRGFKWDTVFPKYDFKIIIDTSCTITAKGIEYRNIEYEKNGALDFGKVFDLWNDYVVCYPLLVYNNGNETAYNHDNIRFIQEAKDTDGKWKPIEFYAGIPSCIPLAEFYEFLPKKYSSFSVIKYHGNFKTKIRVKIKIGEYCYYSNEIEGKINKTQFDKNTAREMLKFMCQFCDGRTPVSEERLSRAFLKNEDN